MVQYFIMSYIWHTEHFVAKTLVGEVVGGWVRWLVGGWGGKYKRHYMWCLYEMQKCKCTNLIESNTSGYFFWIISDKCGQARAVCNDALKDCFIQTVLDWVPSKKDIFLFNPLVAAVLPTFQRFWSMGSGIAQGRGLHSRARFKRDETRRDWTSFPELAVRGQYYFFLVSSLEKIREKSGK